MDVPPTRILDAEGTMGVDDITFPAMVKPLRSELYIDGHLQRFEAARVEDRGEMERALMRCRTAWGSSSRTSRGG